ncbi:MAG: glycosyltransferase [Chloroflexota bacterium]
MTACSGDTSSVQVSVVVCTYRRPATLKRTLRSLLNQSLPANCYEIIVVDNNSGDETAALVSEIATGSQTLIHYAVEPQPGLSHARNHGVQLARAALIAFIDDDAEADRYWLAALLHAYDAHADVWAVGGPVSGVWAVPRPEWVSDDLLRSLSLVEWGDAPRLLTWPERMIGANMSFRREVFEQIGGFNTRLGRRVDMLLSNEDTELQQRIHAHGKAVFYTPAARVWHHVDAVRLNWRYFVQRSFGHGQSLAILALLEPIPLSLERVLLTHLLRLFVAAGGLVLSPLRQRNPLDGLLRVAAGTGFVWQYLRLRSVEPFAQNRVHGHAHRDDKPVDELCPEARQPHGYDTRID